MSRTFGRRFFFTEVRVLGLGCSSSSSGSVPRLLLPGAALFLFEGAGVVVVAAVRGRRLGSSLMASRAAGLDLPAAGATSGTTSATSSTSSAGAGMTVRAAHLGHFNFFPASAGLVIRKVTPQPEQGKRISDMVILQEGHFLPSPSRDTAEKRTTDGTDNTD